MNAFTEREKYEAMWAHDAYRTVAPGEHHVERFLELARPRTGASICDFGCGTGRGAARIAALAPVSVVAVDFAANCLDAGVDGERIRFVQHDLLNPLELAEPHDFGYCTDVLEHIPPGDVEKVLHNIGLAARKVYFAISTVDDVMGALIGEPLHLTVRDPYWWHDTLQRVGYRIDFSRDHGDVVTFYASMFANVHDLCERSSLNLEEDALRSNIKRNLSLGLKEIAPHQVQKDQVVYLLAGGPSLKVSEGQIVDGGRSGIPIVTVNGTYNWLLSKGLKPAAQVMVDGRSFNKRFVEPLVDTCKYLISSQCDHELLKSLPAESTWLWHSADSDLTKSVIDEYAEESNQGREWYPVHGGTTIITRAITLLAMLGFRRLEIFGWDSCLLNDEHHAYPQPENDGGDIFTVKVGDRTFQCHGWMVVQAQDFQRVMQRILAPIEDFEMVVHGDGLISHMIQHAALCGPTEAVTVDSIQAIGGQHGS